MEYATIHVEKQNIYMEYTIIYMTKMNSMWDVNNSHGA